LGFSLKPSSSFNTWTRWFVKRI